MKIIENPFQTTAKTSSSSSYLEFTILLYKYDLPTGWFFKTDIFKCLITRHLKPFESCYYMENPSDRFPFWYLVWKSFKCNVKILTIAVWTKYMKIHWKLIIDKKFRVGLKIGNVSYSKPDIQRSVLSTEPFFRDICRPRYLKTNSDFSVNHWLSMNFRIFSKSKIKKTEIMKVLWNLLKFLGFIYKNGRVLWSFQATCRMLMTKRNIHTVVFVFDSSQGTPCRSIYPQGFP